MADKLTELNRGEVAVVLVGTSGMVREFQNHPQVKFIEGMKRDPELSQKILFDTKVIIITEGLEQMNYAWAMSFCRTNGVVYLARKSNQAVYETLKALLPNGNGAKPSSEEVKEAFVKGKLAPLIPLIDFTKSNAENAKFLLREAQRLNITSTEASLAQLVANQRRKSSGTALPKSARPKLDVAVELFDHMIKEMGDMRDFLIDTVEENRLLRSKLDKFKKAFED